MPISEHKNQSELKLHKNHMCSYILALRRKIIVLCHIKLWSFFCKIGKMLLLLFMKKIFAETDTNIHSFTLTFIHYSQIWVSISPNMPLDSVVSSVVSRETQGGHTDSTEKTTCTRINPMSLLWWDRSVTRCHCAPLQSLSSDKKNKTKQCLLSTWPISWLGRICL